MKIAVWILSDYKPQIGGGFSLYDKMIELIDKYKFSDELEVFFIGQDIATKYNFKKPYLSLNLFRESSMFSKLYLKYIARYSHKINLISKLEIKILKQNNIQLIYYPVQGFKKVNNFPFATANWDIGHRSSFAFPEVTMNGTFEYREKWYAKEMHKALMIFAESLAGKEELIALTNCSANKIEIVPLFAGGVIDLQVNEIDQSNFLSSLKLEKQKFFFYPAQFWAHKNHYNLLLAFNNLIKEFPHLKLVFTGADKGNKKYVEELVCDFGISKNVLFTGFISNETLYTLYKNAIALVMPSFYGPTNMPLIEARDLNCPVLCSDLKGHQEIMLNGAMYFNAASHQSIYNCMKNVLDSNTRKELLTIANATIENSKFNAQHALKCLEQSFIKLKAIRLTWGQNDKIY